MDVRFDKMSDLMEFINFTVPENKQKFCIQNNISYDVTFYGFYLRLVKERLSNEPNT